MKMHPEDFSYIQFCIIEKLSEAPAQAILELRHTIPYKKNQFISFCWYILRVSIRNDKKASSILRDYNDNHIETTIKKILKEYK